jgi:hypothetical protein
MNVRWLLLALAISCGGVDAPPQAAFAREGELIGGTVELVDGGELDLARLRGAPVVVHFFDPLGLGTISDVDELRAARKATPELQIVSIGLDANGKLLGPWRESEGVDWFVARPSQRMLSKESPFGDVMALAPSTVLIDRGGVVAWAHRGALPAGELAKHVASLAPRR